MFKIPNDWVSTKRHLIRVKQKPMDKKLKWRRDVFSDILFLRFGDRGLHYQEIFIIIFNYLKKKTYCLQLFQKFLIRNHIYVLT